jgi:anti-sigma-K factor RskA
MSDVDHTNALAAEYVLGTLDSEEREQARAMLHADTAFAGKVVQWERRLGELHLMVEPVEPDAQIWTRIKSKMPETQSRSNARLPEAHIPEPAPVAIPAAAPSLDAIQAAISETAAVLTSEAAAAPTSEAASPAWETGSPASEAGSPASEITEAPVSEVIEAFGSEPSSVPASEHSVKAMSGAATEAPTPMPDAASAPDVDAAPAPAALESAPPMTDATPTATPDAAAVPAWHATPTPAASVEPESVPPAVPPALATAVAPTPEAPRRIDEATRQTAAARRGLRRWRAFAILMTLVVLAVAALLAAWKFAPERVPPMLQPIEVLRQVGVELPSAGRARRPVPPPSQLEE